VAWSPDGSLAYVTLNGDDSLALVDPEAGTVLRSATVGDGPDQVYLTPDGSRALVANQGTESSPAATLSIVDTAAMAETTAVPTGAGAHGVVVDASGRRAYVTDIYGDTVTVVDLETGSATATIPVGDGPNGVTWSPFTIESGVPRTLELALEGEDRMGEEMEH
jgi:YVTN family beta-propeller protein